ncbi:MAG TPA: competence/damage-inducible protein A [Gemmatimonadaceae bacterium]|nr:competence/damage-inducible protein A [Gemmatimonadaceae bacterium]
MQVEIVTIGDELLLGFTIDTNAAYLARTLAEIGVEIVHRTTVGDDEDRIAAAVRDGIERTGAVITTGGLGPTSDDRTRPAIANLFGRELVRDDAIVEQIRQRFWRMSSAKMPETNIVQAMVPTGARVLENRHGTAPSLMLEDEKGRWVIMLPGVPREMRGLTNDTIIPLLRERVGAAPIAIVSRTVRTTGIGESALAERLGDLAKGVNGLPLAFLPGWEGADLRLTSNSLPVDAAVRALDEAEQMLREAAGSFVYGGERDDLAALVLAMCRERGLTIATAESCTGGLLGARVTAIPGSSDVYVGGVVAYDNSVKTTLLGVRDASLSEHGAVSEQVAREMAEGCARALGTRVGMAITGIAGPGGGTAEKPVGTVWIAVAGAGDTRTLGRVYVGDREEIRLRATQASLDQLRRALALL